MPTIKEPFPYWTTRNNSLLNLMAGSGLGLVRVYYHGEKKKVDLTANLILAAGWCKATVPASASVYNCVGGDCNVTTKALTTETMRHNKAAKEAVEKVVWQSHLMEVQNTYLLFSLYFVLHMLPGIFISLLERYKNRKPIIMKIYRKFVFLNRIARYFGFNKWTFADENTKGLLSRLNARDRQLFDFDMGAVDWISFTTVLYRGIAKYVILDYDNYPKELYKKKMKFIDPIDKAIVWGFLIGAAYFALAMLSVGLSYMHNYSS